MTTTLWLGMAVAAAQDDAGAGGPEVWVGGGVSGGVYVFDSGVTSADTTTTQAEADLALGWGWGHVRVDLDAHFDPAALGPDGDPAGFVTYPNPFPEWGMVQLGREKHHLRLGLLNPNIGVEDWDPWVNYTTTYSNTFIYTGSGRFLGADVGTSLPSGVDLFAFGGYDVDWESMGAGVGVATAQDAFSTWSGVIVYPTFAGAYCHPGGTTSATGSTPTYEPDDCFAAGAYLSFEFYPADPVWIALDTATGVRDGSLWSTDQVILNVIPEAIVNPYARAELLIDPDGVTGAPGHTASVGARTDATDWFRASLEGKTVIPTSGGAVDYGVALVLSVHVPEPLPYSYTDPFGME